jgi:alpha-glucosidase/alpha-D-xyloside xylohydrolase
MRQPLAKPVRSVDRVGIALSCPCSTARSRRPTLVAVLRMSILGLILVAGAGARADTPRIRFAANDAELSITELSPRTVRITLTPPDDAKAVDALNHGSVFAPRRWPEPALKLKELASEHELALEHHRISIKRAPLRIEVISKSGKLIQRLAFDDNSGAVTFRLGEGPVFGLGSGGTTFDRRKIYDAMNNGHRAGEYPIFGSRIPIPFLIGTDGWGLFFHRPYRGSFDLRDTAEGRFEARKDAAQPLDRPLPFDVFVFRADTPADVLNEYTDLVGKPAMPPKWVLGYMQSHRTLAGPDEILKIAETFRSKGLPCDALIYLGTGYTPSGWNTGHGSLDFNPKVFDKPSELIDKFHAQHFKVILHINAAPRNLHGNMPPSSDETEAPDQIATYWKRHAEPLKLGIDGWWPDDGDELPIEARLARHRMYHGGSLGDKPGQRAFSLHRTGYAGMARYGGWFWSGDTFTLWDTLAAHVPIGLNASMSVSPFWGSDTGGFTPTKELTGELYTRWFQFSSFTPSFRSHGRVWHTRLPWGWNTGEFGPNEVVSGTEGSAAPDESELHNAQVEPICKRYLSLRYQWMPYLYSAAREAHDTGMPIMRALWLHYPDDPKAVVLGDEYLWGRDILVAPVVEKGVTKRKLYLPRGLWYDYWGRAPVMGGQEITRYVNLATMPIYIRAGAILPTDPVRQYVDEPTDQPTTLNIYPGANGEFVLYDDDGKSIDDQQSGATWTRLRWDDKSKTLTLEPRDKGKATDKHRRFDVRLIPRPERKSVDYAGERVEVKFE